MNKVRREEANKKKKLEEYLYFNIKNHYKSRDDIVVVCIGTDSCIGDSLGPIIGTTLEKRRGLKGEIEIYGTLKNPVHAKNLDEIFEQIDETNSLVIVIDAALGKESHIGDIIVETGSLFPGIGVGKELIPRGDISIKGIVEKSSGVFTPEILYNVRLFPIYEMAQLIEIALNNALKRIIEERKLEEKKEVCR